MPVLSECVVITYGKPFNKNCHYLKYTLGIFAFCIVTAGFTSGQAFERQVVLAASSPILQVETSPDGWTVVLDVQGNVYHSRNFSSWSLERLDSFSSMALNVSTDSVAYVSGVRQGIISLRPDQLGWSKPDFSLPNVGRVFDYTPAGADTLILLGDQSIEVSVDGGANWHTRSVHSRPGPGMLESGGIFKVAPQTYVAHTFDYQRESSEVVESRDGGWTWESVMPDLFARLQEAFRDEAGATYLVHSSGILKRQAMESQFAPLFEDRLPFVIYDAAYSSGLGMLVAAGPDGLKRIELETLSVTTVDAGEWVATHVSIISSSEFVTTGRQFEDWLFHWVLSSPTSVEPKADIHGKVFDVYPNPAHGTIRLRLHDARSGVTISVFDMAGRKVYATDHGRTTYRETIDIHRQLVPGVYLVRIDADGTSQSETVVILK